MTVKLNVFRKVRTTNKDLERVQDGISFYAQQVIKRINDLATTFTTATLTATTLTATMLKLPITNMTTAEITAAGDDPDVTGITVLNTQTGSGDATINTLVGGVTGQILLIIRSGSNNTILTHLGSGDGTFISTATGSNVTLAGTAGAILIFNGTLWQHIGGLT